MRAIKLTIADIFFGGPDKIREAIIRMPDNMENANRQAVSLVDGAPGFTVAVCCGMRPAVLLDWHGCRAPPRFLYSRQRAYRGIVSSICARPLCHARFCQAGIV